SLAIRLSRSSGNVSLLNANAVRSGTRTARSRATGPSPRPPGPWHEMQYRTYMILPLAASLGSGASALTPCTVANAAAAAIPRLRASRFMTASDHLRIYVDTNQHPDYPKRPIPRRPQTRAQKIDSVFGRPECSREH